MMVTVKRIAGIRLELTLGWLLGGLGVAVSGVGAIIGLTMQFSTWVNTNENELKELKAQTEAIALEQSAGRARGDARQEQISQSLRHIAVLQTQMTNQTEALRQLQSAVQETNRNVLRILTISRTFAEGDAP